MTPAGRRGAAVRVPRAATGRPTLIDHVNADELKAWWHVSNVNAICRRHQRPPWVHPDRHEHRSSSRQLTKRTASAEHGRGLRLHDGRLRGRRPPALSRRGHVRARRAPSSPSASRGVLADLYGLPERAVLFRCCTRSRATAPTASADLGPACQVADALTWPRPLAPAGAAASPSTRSAAAIDRVDLRRRQRPS